MHIKTPVPDAEIYINGNFAGRAHNLKHISLAAGSYRIEQRIGTDVQKQRIYVTAYRKINVELRQGRHAQSAAHAAASAAARFLS